VLCVSFGVLQQRCRIVKVSFISVSGSEPFCRLTMTSACYSTIALLLYAITLLAASGDSTVDFDTLDPYSESHTPRSLSSRIVGGNNADPTRFPYYTYVDIKTDKGRFQCGGTLIHPDIVMTAGHCYQDFIVEGSKIYGMNVWVNVTSIDGGKTGYEYGRHALRAMMHPRYGYGSNTNDILLLQLNATVLGVPLPRVARAGVSPATGTIVTAIGQGLVSENGPFSSSLQAVDVNIISYDDCNDADSYNGRVDPDVMICAGVAGGGKDACSGDSGGPLLIQGVFPQNDVIVGLTSWGEGCAEPEKFGVYTKVSSFFGFITRGICDLSVSKPSSCNAKVPTSRLTSAPTRNPTPAPTPLLSANGLQFPVAVAQPEACTGWGGVCSVAEDCCSLQCIPTNNRGTLCFGPFNWGTKSGQDVAGVPGNGN
jgi:transmembrane protease serine 9